MINRDKIRLMIGLAIYDKHGGHEDLKIAENYRYDYLMTQLFSAFIRYTLCFAIGLGLFLVSSSNDLFVSINTNGFIKTAKGYILYYFAGLLVYFVLTAIVYIVRHNRAVDNTGIFADALTKLNRRFLVKRK